jgi:murein DD-endopeptidase MepM/ murein hydrolase activator NlpD
LVDYSSDEHPDLYGIFAHLSEISIDESDSIDENIQIGVTGKTGSASGKHLHFASMIKLPELGLNAFNKMKKSDWDNLTNQIAAHESLVFNVGKKSVCKYVAPNGSTFVMVDPNGWMGGDSDPWAASTEDGGCGIESQILWKFNVEI